MHETLSTATLTEIDIACNVFVGAIILRKYSLIHLIHRRCNETSATQKVAVKLPSSTTSFDTTTVV